MSRTDPAYWQRLRRDRKSNFAAGFAVVGGLIALVTLTMSLVPGSQLQARANPLYWALLLPFGWWGSSLGAFEAWAMRLFWPSLIGWPLIATCGLAWVWRGGEGVTLWAGTLAASLACSVGAAALYRGSLVQREGPAR